MSLILRQDTGDHTLGISCSKNKKLMSQF